MVVKGMFMKIIQEALKKNSRYVSTELVFMMIFCACFCFGVILNPGAENNIIVCIIVCLIVLLYATFFFLFSFPKARGIIDITKNKTWQELQAHEYADEFILSIDSELKNYLLLEYKEKNRNLNLFITQTWFVLISRNGSTIRKTAEISHMYKDTELDTLVVEFKDGSYLASDCYWDKDKIIQMCKEVLPNISYERE